MNLKTMKILVHIFSITAVVAASYNAYLSWIKDEFSPLLFWATIILAFLSLVMIAPIKRKS